MTAFAAASGHWHAGGMTIVVAALAAANRESAAFAGVIWGAVHWRQRTTASTGVRWALPC